MYIVDIWDFLNVSIGEIEVSIVKYGRLLREDIGISYLWEKIRGISSLKEENT